MAWSAAGDAQTLCRFGLSEEGATWSCRGSRSQIRREDHSWFTRTFSKEARSLVDENTGPTIAAALRSLGWNARAANEVGLNGRSDEDLFAYAWRDDRIIVTQDHDFMDDRRFPPHRNPGVSASMSSSAFSSS